MDRSENDSNIESRLSWTIVLKALADENRLQIIHELLREEASVQDLSNSLDIKTYNISKHLKILETSGLVRKRKVGVHRIYHITEKLRSRITDDNQVLDLGCCKFIFGNP
ncbi:MAG TPA: ArsR family transcriptional regulator [Nitrospirae bacterium]|nr:cadmium resistance transcriptional regulatory protein CadC [bacterium BMS3Abin06]HDH11822.1 ArsR family transcriptional regulator [Nitrospirota bacterium]HDZ02836.1 ArsR family transcriptional regulator [Nitrospirota bacterium]